MTTYSQKHLYSLEAGPPRDWDFIKTQYKTTISLLFPGLGAIDPAVYSTLCIIFDDFTKAGHANVSSMIKKYTGGKIYFVQPELSGDPDEKPFGGISYIRWGYAVTQILCSFVNLHEIKLVIAGIGIEGGMYAAYLYHEFYRPEYKEYVHKLVIQSSALYYEYINSHGLRVNHKQTTIVAAHFKEIDKELGNVITDRVSASCFVGSNIYFPDCADDQDEQSVLSCCRA
jgi:hypothetical protein